MRVLRAIDNISEWSGKIVSFLILFMIGVMTYEVVLRYVFNNPTLWAFETAQFIFGALSILGGAYVLYHGSHVRMDVLYSRLSPRWKAILDLITVPLFLSFCVILLWKGGEIAWGSLQMLETTDSTWRPPVYPIKITIPVAAFLILLQGSAKFIRDLITSITGREIS